ncbi:universal stress protein [Nitrospira defluvii]|nr:universal stress protein [Nitrospira defluvii]
MKTSIKKILVGTDFSSNSDQAIDYAVSFAEKFGAEILLVHVIESFAYSVTDTAIVVSHEKALWVTASALLDNLFKKLVEQDISVKSELAQGLPYRELIKKAEDYGADLIVVGTHGRSAIEHLLMGSVAEKVVRLATCPVLTVRS